MIPWRRGLSVPRPSDHPKLAASLATVAIAALGGPVPAAGTALKELVKHTQARYEADEQSRDLHRRVTVGIRQRALAEQFTEQEMKLGLDLAVETVARYGLTHEQIANLNFDAEDVSRQVVSAAEINDPYWGMEKHYAVAEHGLQVTYGVMIEHLRSSPNALLPAIQALRLLIQRDLAELEATGRHARVRLDDLAAGLIAPGTVAEVKAYLQARIRDWDLSVWHPGTQAASALERRLRARTTGRCTDDQEMTTTEALADQRMLVVLGGPGSGKTWLARRYAREAARAALTGLENGADLNEIELPLFTTWNQWTKTTGDPRHSLVAASFASGLGHTDLGESADIRRLQRTLTQPGRRVLAVVDSLDEAADLAGQANQLHELTSLHGWRVVVTSRPAAWDVTFRGDPARADGPRVAHLQDLVYPADVDAFVRAWFAADRGRGDALVEQIRARSDLARAAVIPLILTFYCLLTETPAPVAQPLPARRRDLYGRLVQRLLLGRWATYGRPPDADYCKKLLTEWAWHAVRDRTTPTGLDDWADTFEQPTAPRDGERRAIDHVAPTVTEDDEGVSTRRFIHRTVLEHFVAEHIASLDPDQAARILLPHLWFDPDWEVAAPAAAATHNRRQPGALLQQLLDQAVNSATDMARQAANREFDKLCLTFRTSRTRYPCNLWGCV